MTLWVVLLSGACAVIVVTAVVEAWERRSRPDPDLRRMARRPMARRGR